MHNHIECIFDLRAMMDQILCLTNFLLSFSFIHSLFSLSNQSHEFDRS